MYSDTIMRAIKTHYPKDFEILKGILQTIPLSCKLMMKGGAEYMFVDTKEDEIGYEIINNKNAKNFAISYTILKIKHLFSFANVIQVSQFTKYL